MPHPERYAASAYLLHVLAPSSLKRHSLLHHQLGTITQYCEVHVKSTCCCERRVKQVKQASETRGGSFLTVYRNNTGRLGF